MRASISRVDSRSSSKPILRMAKIFPPTRSPVPATRSRSRVNELGVSEPLIQTRGDNQIIVELPGVSDPEQAVNVIRETALLEVVDPAGAFVQDGMIVETSLGGPDDVLSDGTPEATPAATPVDGSTPVTAATPEAEVAASRGRHHR